MDYFSLWLSALTIAAQGGLQLLFSGRFTGKQLKAWHFLLYLAALYGLDGVFAHQGGLAVFGMLAALYGTNRLLLGSGRVPSCVTAVISVYVTELSFGILNSIEAVIFPRMLGRAALLNAAIAGAVLTALALCVLFYWIILRRCSLRQDPAEPYIWMLLPMCLFYFAAELYILRTAYGAAEPYRTQAGKNAALLAVQVLGLAALFASLLACQRARDGFRAQSELASLAQAADAQKTYVAQAKMRYELTRSFRHDVNSHLSVLAGLLAGGKLEQAKAYLEKLKVVAGELSFPYHSGNPVVDILLEDKLELAIADGAEVQVSLRLPQPCGADDLDLCVIFSNALDNAIQACGAVRGKKWISIQGKQQGSFYLLVFENSCRFPAPVAAGIGLSNIRTAAERYGGAMTVEKTSSSFCLNVLLNISRHPQDRSLQSP